MHHLNFILLNTSYILFYIVLLSFYSVGSFAIHFPLDEKNIYWLKLLTAINNRGLNIKKIYKYRLWTKNCSSNQWCPTCLSTCISTPSSPYLQTSHFISEFRKAMQSRRQSQSAAIKRQSYFTVSPAMLFRNFKMATRDVLHRAVHVLRLAFMHSCVNTINGEMDLQQSGGTSQSSGSCLCSLIL